MWTPRFLLVTAAILLGIAVLLCSAAASLEEPSPGGGFDATEGPHGATRCVSHSKCTDAFSLGNGFGCAQCTAVNKRSFCDHGSVNPSGTCYQMVLPNHCGVIKSGFWDFRDMQLYCNSHVTELPCPLVQCANVPNP